MAVAATQAGASITLQQLAHFVGESRMTVRGWIRKKQLTSRRLPGHSQQRPHRIRILDAIRFAEENGLPTESLLRWAERHGVVTVRTPSVLVVSTDCKLTYALAQANMDAAPARSWFHFDLLIAKRTFEGVVVESTFGRGEIEERARWIADYSPQTIVIVIVGQSEAPVKGADACMAQPLNGAAVAKGLWARLKARMP